MGDDDFEKLPVTERVTHKLWKARVHGYQEAEKLFRLEDDPKGKAFEQFGPLIKGFIVDSNAAAQASGLAAALLYVETAAAANRHAKEISAGIVAKCFNSPKANTVKLATDICLMLVEVECADTVLEELLKGFSNRQPKVIARSACAIRTAVESFGAKVFQLKPLLKGIPTLLGHADKNVREEGKQLVVELYRWIKAAVQTGLKDVKPVMMKELEQAWGALPNEPAVPTRYRRSEQAKAEAAAAAGDGGEGAAADGGDDGAAAAEEIDPYDLVEAVDILSKMSKTFFTDVRATKWSERKEALEGLLKVASVPKIQEGDFGDISKELKNVIAKDSNVLNVTFAAKCVAALAEGLRKAYANQAIHILSAVLAKFKEKKANVVAALSLAGDKIFVAAGLEKMTECLAASLQDKNPEVKAQTALLISRCVQAGGKAAVPKPSLKALGSLLVTKLSDPAVPVRDGAAKALGALLKALGEKPMASVLEPVRQDKIKMEKIESAAAACTVASGGGAAPAAGAAASAPKKASAPAPRKKSAGSPPKKGGRPTTAPAKRPGPKAKAAARPATAASGKSSGSKSGSKSAAHSASIDDPTFPDMSDGEVDQKCESLVPEAIRTQLLDAAWKERLEGAQKLAEHVGNCSVEPVDALALFKYCTARSKKWKETNFQVFGALVGVLAAVAAKIALPDRCVHSVVPPLTEKLGDIKLKQPIANALTAFCESVGVNYVSLRVCQAAQAARNPKVPAGALNWMGETIKDFGLQVAVKPHVAFIRKNLAATNPAVRTAAVDFAGVLYLYIGSAFQSMFADEKPALVSTLQEKFSSLDGEKPPAPTKAHRVAGSGDGDDGGEEEGDAAAEGKKKKRPSKSAPAHDPMDDLIPRSDLSAVVSEDTVAKMSDPNWKVRGEALDEVKTALAQHPRLQPDFGPAGHALRARLGDSNKNHIMTALGLLGTCVAAAGPGAKRFVAVYLEQIVQTLADNKDTVRAAAIACLNEWHSVADMDPFFESETIAHTLAKGKPNAQKELLVWLLGKLDGAESVPKLNAVVKPLFGCLEHRNADIRKAAQQFFPIVVQSCGKEKLLRLSEKLTPSSRATITGQIEACKVTKPAPAAAAPAKEKKVEKKPEKKAAAEAPADAPKTGIKKAGTIKRGARKGTIARKPAPKDKGAAVVQGPALLGGDSKAQREADERAMKVLKWNFATPRDEFVQQLQAQMKSCVSEWVHELMFSTDFRSHAKALDALIESVKGTPEKPAPQAAEAAGAVDVLLKWVTLRFFETNTTVILKSMQFLQELLSTLSAADYEMTEPEAASFVPYLILRFGDKIESVRKDCHGLIKTLSQVYPASKLFSYVLDGLKSKNAKQRAECLNEIDTLIGRHGMQVCQMGAAKALKVIASQISDRENTVRSAALDAVVTVYNIVSEDVYKLMGNIGEKNTSLVQERIKRHAKKKPEAKEASGSTSASSGASSAAGTKIARHKSMKRNKSGGVDKKEKPKPEEPSVPQEFSLDLDSLQMPLQTAQADTIIPELQPTDPDELANSPASKQPESQESSSASRFSEVVAEIGGSNIAVAIDALKAAESLAQDVAPSLVPHVDVLVGACMMQLRMVFGSYLGSDRCSEDAAYQTEVVRVLKHVLSCLLHVFNAPKLALEVSQARLREIIADLTTRLLDPKLENLSEGAQISKAINLILLKMLEQANKSDVFEALLGILSDAVGGTTLAPPRFTELIMKCTWKITKLLPEIVADIDLPRLLLNVHKFLEEHPPVAWKQRDDDTPLRTMKTILHSLVKIKGADVLKSLTLVGQNPTESTVGSYLILMLQKAGHDPQKLAAMVPEPASKARTPPKQQKQQSQEKQQQRQDGQKPAQPEGTAPAEPLPTTESAKARLSKLKRSQSVNEFARMEAQASQVVDEPPADEPIPGDIDAQLAVIFGRIQAKDTTKQGLTELCSLKARFPTLDYATHLAKLSPFMQKYVERNLTSSTTDRPSTPAKTPASTAGSSLPAPSGTAADYLAKLRSLTATSGRRRSAGSSIPLPTFEIDKKKEPLEEDLPDVVAEQREPLALKRLENRQDSAANLDSLKARLAKMKRQQSQA
eukprot:m.283246 g.283246  ORF g.283246 m.283246 type:complete len:2080 (+) comp19412_c0_seq6:220-6459(+)